MKIAFGATIALIMVLASATSTFAQEVLKIDTQKVGASVIDSKNDDITRPKPSGPGGSDAKLIQPGSIIDSKINSRVRPRPKGPGGSEELQRIQSIQQVQNQVVR
jgi:hypothetical protein